MSSLKVRELIRSIRACKTAAEERAVISKECALIRNAFKEENIEFRHRNIAKLLFINLLGYPTQFGQIECTKLIASQNFTEKRIGYLALSQILNESVDIILMVTHSLKTDLNNNQNNYIVALALTAMGEISTVEMCRELYQDVKKLMGNSHSYIKQKATLAAIRIINMLPDTLDDFEELIPDMLQDKHHSVLMSTLSLLQEILKREPSYKDKYRKYLSTLIRALKNLLLAGFNPEYDISGVKDPFLQMKILQILKVLGEGNAAASDEMNDVLAQIATNTESHKNTGNTILYECVRTIMTIESSQGLRVLGINILGRFLINRENNIRFVALKTLQKVVDIDYQAVQKHKNTIVECLKDHDMAIKKRALDLLYQICNASNVKSIVKELVNFLLVSDGEFKQELATKICMAAEKYSPNSKWHVDTMIKVCTLAGNFVKEGFVDNIISIIGANANLHSYSVHKVYFAMKENVDQQGIVHLGLWLIGEYGDLLISATAIASDDSPIVVKEEDVMDLYHKITTDYHKKRNDTIIQLALTSLSKLSIRFQSSWKAIQEILDKFTDSINIETQQRACEYLQLYEDRWAKHRNGIFETIPAFKNSSTLPTDENDDGIIERGIVLPDDTKTKIETPAPTTTDVLGLLFGSSETPQQEQQPISSTSTFNPLAAIFGDVEVKQDNKTYGMGGIFSPMPETIVNQPPSTGLNFFDITDINETHNDFSDFQGGDVEKKKYLAYGDSNIQIHFDIKKDVFNSNLSLITAFFSNLTDKPIASVSLLVAVQKQLKLELDPASSNTLQPSKKEGISQLMKITDTRSENKGITLKLKINYTINGVEVSKTEVVKDLKADS